MFLASIHICNFAQKCLCLLVIAVVAENGRHHQSDRNGQQHFRRKYFLAHLSR